MEVYTLEAYAICHDTFFDPMLITFLMHLIFVGSASTGDAGGNYSSNYSADYMPRGSDVSLL